MRLPSRDRCARVATVSLAARGGLPCWQGRTIGECSQPGRCRGAAHVRVWERRRGQAHCGNEAGCRSRDGAARAGRDPARGQAVIATTPRMRRSSSSPRTTRPWSASTSTSAMRSGRSWTSRSSGRTRRSTRSSRGCRPPLRHRHRRIRRRRRTSQGRRLRLVLRRGGAGSSSSAAAGSSVSDYDERICGLRVAVQTGHRAPRTAGEGRQALPRGGQETDHDRPIQRSERRGPDALKRTGRTSLSATRRRSSMRRRTPRRSSARPARTTTSQSLSGSRSPSGWPRSSEALRQAMQSLIAGARTCASRRSGASKTAWWRGHG